MSETKKITIVWHIEDVDLVQINMRKAGKIDRFLSADEMGDVLDIMKFSHDAEYGITWDTVEATIKNVINGGTACKD